METGVEKEYTFVLREDSAEYYVNGSLTGTVALDSSKSQAGLFSDTMYIFSRDMNSRLINMKLKYLDVYGLALSAEEVKNNYNARKGEEPEQPENGSGEIIGGGSIQDTQMNSRYRHSTQLMHITFHQKGMITMMVRQEKQHLLHLKNIRA